MTEVSKNKSGSILNNPTFRSIAYQLLLAVIIIWGGYIMAVNAGENMEAQGMKTGFDFLSQPAGFEVAITFGLYEVGDSYLKVFILGIVNTLVVAVVGVFIATTLGFLIGVMRLSHNWVVNKIATVYVETFRNIPLLLQILFWYIAVLSPLPSPRQAFEKDTDIYFALSNRGLAIPDFVPQDGFSLTLIALLIAIIASILISRWSKKRQIKTGEQFPVFFTALGLIILLPALMFLITGMPMEANPGRMGRFNLEGGGVINPEFMAIVFSLSIYTAAFIAEIVRSGIQAISHGQTEAAHALGLRNRPTLRLVIIPQALRIIIPPLTNQFLNLTKNSSLAVAIAYPDLVAVFAGTALSQHGQALEALGMTMLVYLTFSLVISMIMNWYNSRVKLIER